MIEFIIDEEYETVRIDRFLRKHLKNIALSEIYKMLRKAKIKVNNKKVSQDYRLVLGDIIFVFLPENFEEKNEETFIELNEIRKEKLKSMIAYENENLFIINKNLGDVIHKGSGHDISLLEEFRSYYSNNKINFVNRIDKLTSGLVIGAKNSKALRELNKIKENSIEKYYKTVVSGKVKKNFIINEKLVKNEEKNKSTISKNGKDSITEVYVEKNNDEFSLLKIKLITGRTHQIRSHLSSKGFYIIGDIKYGNPEINRFFRTNFDLKSQFLHAETIIFKNVDGDLSYLNDKEFFAPMDDTYKNIIRKIFW